jgi:hypothetical protein
LIYFGTKNDLATVVEFLPIVKSYWDAERSLKDRSISNTEELMERYTSLRESIARKTPNIIHISRRAGIPSILQSYPAPAVGGPVIPVDIYESILQDDSHGVIPNQRKMDTLNKLIGQLEGKIYFEFKKIINPLFWFGLGLEKILRIPFWLLSKTGFKIGKIEDHLLGKVFKLIEIIVLFYVSLKLGVPDEWVTAILGAIGK